MSLSRLNDQLRQLISWGGNTEAIWFRFAPYFSGTAGDPVDILHIEIHSPSDAGELLKCLDWAIKYSACFDGFFEEFSETGFSFCFDEGTWTSVTGSRMEYRYEGISDADVRYYLNLYRPREGSLLNRLFVETIQTQQYELNISLAKDVVSRLERIQNLSSKSTSNATQSELESLIRNYRHALGEA